ncbi:endonuclease/exonuclease/phosphatase family protein [Zhenhengia yiwuensis]|uniref:endonuclease/exonuclease/phosphatase family protein n=1 Tax=Zhenhengia yiwuensis TaxID=2763666 RepID=UPI002A763C8D|nr:endonuclease/exonuclease/phosphatase family protein [Zhenhengia yiwuensis]MDY3368707.1 endonuclease/exonuclease/phosphatase family protein [Zhenhengia yiwuensis]
MKLLTLNCHSWQEVDQQHKIKVLAQEIKDKGYDVIALQEVSQPIDGDVVVQGLKEGNFVYALLDALKEIDVTEYDFRWGFSHIGYEVYEEGLCLLSKHPIVEEQEFFVTKGHDTNYWKTRKIVKIAIDYKGKTIDFYTCHLGWWIDEEEPFKYQIDTLNVSINSNRLSFMMGDFNNNANVRDEGYDYMISKGWVDTYTLAEKKDEGITVQGKIDGWEKNQAGLRIDLIWANQPIKVLKSQVCFNGINKEIVSDHFGVEMECEV